MIRDRIGRREVPLPISLNRYNVRENKRILFSERALQYQMSKIRENITALQIRPFWKMPRLVGLLVIAMVIVITSV